MRPNAALLTILLLSHAVPAKASPAPGFDCHKASSPIEKVICSDEYLSERDNQLAKKFAEAIKSNPQDKKFLIENQRAWLKKRLEQCSYSGPPAHLDASKFNCGDPPESDKHEIDKAPAQNNLQINVSCLQELYEERINTLSYPEFLPPLREASVKKALKRFRTMDPEILSKITTPENRDTLSELSCKFFEQDPAAASKTFATNFGSSLDGWNPLCRTIDIADRVPEIKTLLTALEPIWGASSSCDGTMRFAYGRSEMIIRILAAVDPNPMKNEAGIPPLDSVAIGYTPDLKHWSQQGNWEKQQYEALQPIIDNARNALSQYYQKTFNTGQSQANAAAGFHITQIIRQQTEHSGSSSTLSYMSLCFDKGDLDTYLKFSVMPTKICPYGEYADVSKEATLRRFLGLAIVNQYPLEGIKKLIADGAELNQKRSPIKNIPVKINDSPLMLAAPYPEIVALLLKAGSDVNEQNDFGKTALMYAIQEQNVKSVSMMLDAHADVNAKTFENIECSALKAGSRTPLMYAAWEANAEIIRMIVAAHADIDAKDTNDETALNYLKHNENLSPEEKAELEKLLQTSHQDQYITP